MKNDILFSLFECGQTHRFMGKLHFGDNSTLWWYKTLAMSLCFLVVWQHFLDYAIFVDHQRPGFLMFHESYILDTWGVGEGSVYNCSKKGEKMEEKSQSVILSVLAFFFPAFFHPLGEAYGYCFESLTLVGVGLVMDLCSSWALHALLSFLFGYFNMVLKLNWFVPAFLDFPCQAYLSLCPF